MMHRSPIGAAACAAALLIAGCGTQAASHVATSTGSDATPPVASSPVAPTTEQTAAVDQGPKSVAPPLRLGLGDVATLSDPSRGVALRVTPLSLHDPLDPPSSGEVDAADRYVGFDLRIVNAGTKPFNGPLIQNGASLTYGQSGSTLPNPLTSGCLPFPARIKLAVGATTQGCVAFAVPKQAKLDTLQLTMPTDFGGVTAWWTARVIHGGPNQRAGEAPRDAGPTTCAGNVTVMGQTTCPFAEAVHARFTKRWHVTGPRDVTITAPSAAAGRRVTMSCHVLAHGNVLCRNAWNAYVQFPSVVLSGPTG